MKNSFIEGAISPEKIATSIAHHQHKTNIGGHSIFLGQVRADEIDQKVVKAIEFTTYRELAEQKIATIREDIFEKYALTCMHIYHSLGDSFFSRTSTKAVFLLFKICSKISIFSTVNSSAQKNP